MTRTCAIFGCSPMCFPWGFDEEDEGCAALKLILLNRISALRSEGCSRFHISMDCGAGLYAAEILHGLRENDSKIEAICHIPYEEQAVKWTPELRERYYKALANCTGAEMIARTKSVGCEYKAHLNAVLNADTVIAVYDPDNPRCEREAAIAALIQILGKPFTKINPAALYGL